MSFSQVSRYYEFILVVLKRYDEASYLESPLKCLGTVTFPSDLPVLWVYWKAGTGRRPTLSQPMISQQLSGL